MRNNLQIKSGQEKGQTFFCSQMSISSTHKRLKRLFPIWHGYSLRVKSFPKIITETCGTYFAAELCCRQLIFICVHCQLSQFSKIYEHSRQSALKKEHYDTLLSLFLKLSSNFLQPGQTFPLYQFQGSIQDHEFAEAI